MNSTIRVQPAVLRLTMGTPRVWIRPAPATSVKSAEPVNACEYLKESSQKNRAMRLSDPSRWY